MATPLHEHRKPEPDDGDAALRRGAWESARACFLARIDGDPTHAEAWEGLGTACYWLQDAPQMFEARRQAYRLYRQRGEHASGARVALWLAADFLEFRGEAAVAEGWLERARQLLEGTEPCPVHALMYAIQAHLARARNDPAAALAAAVEARKIACELGGPPAQEILARASEGLSLVGVGQVADGLRRLDAAAAAALGGETDDLHAISITCCYVLQACERVRDFPRASEWYGRFEELCVRWSIGKFLTFCRIQHGTLLLWQGRWQEAEAELIAARDELEIARPAARTAAIVRLGELRRRQGRLEEAAALFEEAHTHPLAAVWRGMLALDRGDHIAAEEMAAQALRRVAPANAAERFGALELLVRARAGLHDLGRAEEARRQLDAAATSVGTDVVRAAALLAAGVLARESGELDEARRKLQDAADVYERCESPFEAGISRVELARALHALGRSSAARAQARAGLEIFERLGAEGAAERARHLLEEIPAPSARRGGAAPPRPLTARQVEVLRLVARGLSNREVGARLSLSEFTVRRHLSNLYLRLGVSSRAAAVARALRDRLI